MTLQQLIYFRKIVEHRSFIKASRELFVTQPTISYAIQLLEQELEVPLFIREKGKPLVLTSYGQLFLPYVDNMLEILEEGVDAIRKARNPEGGVIRIGVVLMGAYEKVMRAVTAFRALPENKDVMIDISVIQQSADFLDQIKDGTLDFAFSGLSSASQIECLNVFPEDLRVTVPKGHPLAALSHVNPSDLAKEPLIMYAQDMRITALLERVFASCGVDPNIVTYEGNWTAILSGILMGKGIAISPWIPMSIQDLVSIPFINPTDEHWTINLLWSCSHKLSPAAARFLKFMKDYAPSAEQPGTLFTALGPIR